MTPDQNSTYINKSNYHIGRFTGGIKSTVDVESVNNWSQNSFNSGAVTLNFEFLFRHKKHLERNIAKTL